MIERTSSKLVNRARDLMRCYKIVTLPLLGIALVLVRLDQECLSLAMRVNNPDRSPFKIER